MQSRVQSSAGFFSFRERERIKILDASPSLLYAENVFAEKCDKAVALTYTAIASCESNTHESALCFFRPPYFVVFGSPCNNLHIFRIASSEEHSLGQPLRTFLRIKSQSEMAEHSNRIGLPERQRSSDQYILDLKDVTNVAISYKVSM